MKKSAEGPNVGVNYYSSLCVAALVVLLLVLYARGAGFWSFLPVVLGLVGVAVRWSVGPAVVLIAFAAALKGVPELSFRYVDHGPSADRLWDVVLAAALLIYVVGQYRLQSLANYVFPPDVNRRQERQRKSFFSMFQRKKEVVKQRRSGAGVTPEEIGAVVLVLPLWVLGGLLCQSLIEEAGTWPGPLPRLAWRGMMAAWVFAVPPLIAGGLLRVWTWQKISADEATAFLQDQVWHETRREQRRLNRWLAWARLRRQRREEKS